MTKGASATELLARELHRAHLKPLGFTKRHKVFERAKPEYTEVVQIEASSHGMAPGPWRFGVTIGARFEDCPSPPHGFHLSADLGRLVPHCPSRLEVDLEDIKGQAGALYELIALGLSRMPQFVQAAKPNAEKGLVTLVNPTA
jgi:hypothetical protein